MESRKDLLNTFRICRFCLAQESLTSLYGRYKETKKGVPLKLKILSSVSIEVFPSDRMPTFICSRCKFFMEMCYEFKEICHKADKSIYQYIENGAPLQSIAWPSSLTKVWSREPESKVVMKTVVDGGTTVQVTTQDISDDDDDDENVYSVKIDDGSDEGSKSARIKVITGHETVKTNSPSKLKRKEFATVSKLAKHVRSHAGDRAYPCKFCDKSFIKSHHYTRHLRGKHRSEVGSGRGPFGQAELFRCEQCSESFATQDEFIYHSAIHATQNLTCPLCQERFLNVDDVTAHIKSHVTGTEFMCDFCELVFTSKDKLDSHVTTAHEEEMRTGELGLEESSMEADADAEDEDEPDLNVTEEGGQMIVEINKPDNFMFPMAMDEGEDKDLSSNPDDKEDDKAMEIELSRANNLMFSNSQDGVDQSPNVPSEDSESEMTFSNLSNVDTTAMVKGHQVISEGTVPKPQPATVEKQNAHTLKKPEEIKRKVIEKTAPDTVSVKSKEKVNSKVESSNSVGASDKSLRLLEKELQELKRTNPQTAARNEVVKSVTTLRGKRSQVHTSTPKVSRATEDRKSQIATRSPVPGSERRGDRRLTKENKEPREGKDPRPKEAHTPADDDKDSAQTVVKNGASDKNPTEEGIRRSTRPSKIKDYAKMIRDSSQEESNDDDSDNYEDEEYKEEEISPEPTRPKSRRVSVKQAVKPAPVAASITPSVPKKRGRPRKDQSLKKVEAEEPIAKVVKNNSQNGSTSKDVPAVENDDDCVPVESETKASGETPETSQTPPNITKLANIVMSPTGQTLKKVPIKALPPGVKPLPLPATARTIGGEVCEMQIGKKMVKVQKIVMTKAEVEAMTKKGLVEMKDGTMVLKQGIKIPSADPVALKSLVGEGRVSPKKPKGTPMRCDLGDD